MKNEVTNYKDIRMDYSERVQNAVNFIEANLTYPIALKEVAQKAGCSLFHFHRMFQATAGYSLKEYIRKRRLAEAAHTLLYSKKGILEIALDYGYESQESFTRAFQKETGRLPGEFRKTRASFRSFPPIDIKSLKQVNLSNFIEPKIIEKVEFTVIGPAIRINNNNEGGFRCIPKFWNENNKKDIYTSIPNKISDKVCWGISMDFKGSEFTYMIALEVSSLKEIPAGMIGRKIPGAKYAVFTAKGPCAQSTQDLLIYIFSDWIFQSGQAFTDGPELELYDERFNFTDKCETEIYIPIE